MTKYEYDRDIRHIPGSKFFSSPHPKCISCGEAFMGRYRKDRVCPWCARQLTEIQKKMLQLSDVHKRRR